MIFVIYVTHKRRVTRVLFRASRHAHCAVPGRAGAATEDRFRRPDAATRFVFLFGVRNARPWRRSGGCRRGPRRRYNVNGPRAYRGPVRPRPEAAGRSPSSISQLPGQSVIPRGRGPSPRSLSTAPPSRTRRRRLSPAPPRSRVRHNIGPGVLAPAGLLNFCYKCEAMSEPCDTAGSHGHAVTRRSGARRHRHSGLCPAPRRLAVALSLRRRRFLAGCVRACGAGLFLESSWTTFESLMRFDCVLDRDPSCSLHELQVLIRLSYAAQHAGKQRPPRSGFTSREGSNCAGIALPSHYCALG